MKFFKSKKSEKVKNLKFENRVGRLFMATMTNYQNKFPKPSQIISKFLLNLFGLRKPLKQTKCHSNKQKMALFQKVLICHSEPAIAGEESINSRHFHINLWIIHYAQNDKYGILFKINTFLQKAKYFFRKTPKID